MSDSRKVCKAAKRILDQVQAFAYLAREWQMSDEADFEELVDSVENELERFLRKVKSDGQQRH